MPTKTFKYHLLALAVVGMMTASAWADDNDENTNTTHLGTLKVTTKKKAQQGKLGERTISRQQLNEENIQNAHDLVRYNTEVDVAEVGRYGNKGFAVRGVDGNRVAMNIDGVALPTVESNEIFSPYGYIYEGRFNPDTELLGGVRVSAGADSLLSGSGAIGGSVSYSTKEPYHLVRGDRTWGGYAKLGYTSKNEEKLASVGLAGIYNRAEFLLNYSHRAGHELKNHDMKKHDKARMAINYTPSRDEMGRVGENRSSTVVDAVDYKKDSILGKFYYHPNDQHRFGLSALYQKQNTNSLAYSKSGTSGGNRLAQDVEEGKGYGASYLYSPNNSRWLNDFDVNYQYQDILGLADTDIYSNGIRSRKEYRPTQTKTHQAKIDTTFLPIDFGRFGEHSFRLSGLYNKQDYKSTNVAVRYDTAGNITQAIQPYIIVFPDAKKDNYALTLSDNIRFGERFSADLGLRYDYYRYTPYFQNDVYFDDIRSSEQNEIQSNLNRSWIRAKFYQDYRNGVYDQKPDFKKFTYSGAFDYQIIPNRLTARYKIGTGFLAPTVTQMYSAFQGLAVKQIINPHLKPETSLNQELEFEIRPTKNTMLTLAGYTSKYDNFIHTRYWQYLTDADPRNEDQYGCARVNGTCTMSLNLDTAKVTGLKVGIEADLSEKLKTNGKFSVFANYHTAKDSAIIETDNGNKLTINTLAATPTNFVLGADYVSANNDWSLHGRIRGLMAKKAKDTKYVDVEEIVTGTTTGCPSYIISYYGYCPAGFATTTTTYDYNEFVNTYEHANRSKNAFIYDLYGTKKFGKDKNLILNAGIYNIMDVKYIPWDSLRQFHNLSANTMVDDKGAGFNRYTAPGRNFALSLTYEF